MRKLIGTLVTWLLLAAIPVQGQAATAALFCGAGHHGVLAQFGAQRASAEHHAEIATGANVAKGEWLTMTATGDDPIVQDPVEQVSEWTGQVNDDDKCGAYSAIVSEPIVVEQTVVLSRAIPYTLASFINCIPQRLDPPPRSAIA